MEYLKWNLANMSHEIRTPINAMLGMNSMILRETKEEKTREYALDIENAGNSLLSIINDILDVSKMASGKMELLPAEYDFSKFIHEVMNMIILRARTKDLSVELEIDENLPSVLWGDDVRLRQILLNLLSNSVKYTNEGCITLSVSGERTKDGVLLEFHVKDTGIGIRENDLEKLSVAFERIEEYRNRNIEGTGLGITITTKLLELMDSRLEVESQYGKGSDFHFHLFQKIVKDTPIGNLQERISREAGRYFYHASFTAPEAKILVVDDNAMNRKVFVNLLKETKVQIDEAAGGEECLKMVADTHYDIIFLDHMMPDMDGLEVLHRMQEWKYSDEFACKNTPVVSLTANAMSGARERYLEEGFDDFLSKPIHPDHLEKILAEILPPEKINHGALTSAGKGKLLSEADGEYGEKDDSLETLAEQLPEIDGVDWEYALLHMKNKELLLNTINDFYHMNDSEAEQLETFWKRLLQAPKNTGDYEELLKQYRYKIHAMKSSAAMIGAVAVSGLARLLEYGARDGKITLLNQLTEEFLSEWKLLKQELSPLAVTDDNQEDKPAGDASLLLEYLRLLEQAMEEMDVDTADEIIRQFLRYHYPDDQWEVMKNLEDGVTNLDGEKVKKECNKMRELLQA